MPRFEGGTECDALPTGEFAVVMPDHVATHLGPIPFRSATERPRYPRITNVGGFKIAAQNAGGFNTLEYRGSQWHHLPTVPVGTSPVIYDRQGQLLINDGSAGANGYRYIDPVSGVAVTGDATYTPTGAVDLHEWTDLGDGWYVGQGPTGGLWVKSPQGYAELSPGAPRFIRATRDGDRVAVACYLEGAAVVALVLLATLDDWLALPMRPSPRTTVPPPVPDPPPLPEPEPMPEIDTRRLHAALVAERAKYPATLQAEAFAASILNAACWAVREEGWGLSAKPTGNQIWSVEHQRHVSYDALHHQPTDTIWDVATDEWPTMRITTPNHVEHHGRADRPWLAPVRPTTDDEPDPPPPPPPSDGTLAARVGALEVAVAEIQAALTRGFDLRVVPR